MTDNLKEDQDELLNKRVDAPLNERKEVEKDITDLMLEEKVEERQYTQDIPPGIGWISAFFTLFVPTWCILVPIGFVIYIITLPFRILWWLATFCKKRKDTEMECKVVECTGQSKDTIMFVHGWPDSGQCWDNQVNVYKANYRCLVLTLPNYQGDSNSANGAWGFNLTQIADQLAKLVKKHCPDDPRVTIMAHDFGNSVSYRFIELYPQHVKRIIPLDIAGDIKVAGGMILATLSYHWFNILCFLLGSPAGKFMMQVYLYLREGYQGRPYSQLQPIFSYLYYHSWKEIFSGAAKPFIPKKPLLDRCPIMFVHAKRKYGLAYSYEWKERMEEHEHCRFFDYDCGHWIQLEEPQQLNKDVLEWLDETQNVVDKKRQ